MVDFTTIRVVEMERSGLVQDTFSREISGSLVISWTIGDEGGIRMILWFVKETEMENTGIEPDL